MPRISAKIMKLLAELDAREKGQVPVTIGTSLALEGAFGIYPDRPVSTPPIQDYKEVWVNVRTLFRNLISCISTDLRDKLLPAVLVPALIEEMNIIESAVSRASAGMTRTIFYASDYSDLNQKFYRAKLRTATTPKQIFQRDLENATFKALLQETLSVDMRGFRTEITGKHPASLIMTHYPVDLLSRGNFAKLALLESHTGLIKPSNLWYTKLTNGKELANIPFGAFSLQVFGDNGNQFMPAVTPSLRKQLLELAVKDRWTSVSTREKLLTTIRKLDDKVARADLLSLL